jgi:hypothetical protein
MMKMTTNEYINLIKQQIYQKYLKPPPPFFSSSFAASSDIIYTRKTRQLAELASSARVSRL